MSIEMKILSEFNPRNLVEWILSKTNKNGTSKAVMKTILSTHVLNLKKRCAMRIFRKLFWAIDTTLSADVAHSVSRATVGRHATVARCSVAWDSLTTSHHLTSKSFFAKAKISSVWKFKRYGTENGARRVEKFISSICERSKGAQVHCIKCIQSSFFESS